MPFGLQPTHLILILVVALLIFGPSRLPELGRSLGSTLREFQTATKDATRGLEAELTAAPAQPTAVATVPCQNCQKPMQAGMKFCPECGAAQLAAAPCPTCQKLVQPGMKFCPECGAAQPAVAPAAAASAGENSPTT